MDTRSYNGLLWAFALVLTTHGCGMAIDMPNSNDSSTSSGPNFASGKIQLGLVEIPHYEDPLSKEESYNIAIGYGVKPACSSTTTACRTASASTRRR